MTTVGILPWQNECSLSPYPLSKSFGFDNLLVDANFVQFDAFLPTLVSISTTLSTITFTVQFDGVIVSSEVGPSDGIAQFFSGSTYLGGLVFNTETAYELITAQANQTILVNVSFLPIVVTSIPSKAGVYKLGNAYAVTELEHDANITYVGDLGDNSITFNAVAFPTLLDTVFLKSLNSVAPTNNNIHIQESDLVKITAETVGTLRFSITGSGNEIPTT
jgi:hypothetical protein